MSRIEPHILFAFHWKQGKGIGGRIAVFELYAADLTAGVGGKVIDKTLCIHTGSIDRADRLAVFGLRKAVWLIYSF